MKNFLISIGIILCLTCSAYSQYQQLSPEDFNLGNSSVPTATIRPEDAELHDVVTRLRALQQNPRATEQEIREAANRLNRLLGRQAQPTAAPASTPVPVQQQRQQSLPGGWNYDPASGNYFRYVPTNNVPTNRNMVVPASRPMFQQPQYQLGGTGCPT